MQNMHNQNEAVLEHCKEGISVLVSKNHFYDREIFACINFIIIIVITLFKVDKNTNVIRVTSNKIAAISIEKH